MAMKTRRRKRQPATEETSAVTPTTIFSSDLLTPEEERELDSYVRIGRFLDLLCSMLPKER